MFDKYDFLKKLILWISIIICIFTLFSFKKLIILNKDDLIGVYLTPNKKSHISFTKREGLYFGKLIWNVNPNIKDRHNPSKELKNKNLIGLNIFTNFKYNKYTRSWTGKFYDAESGTTYDCDLWLENSNKKLMARGYIETPALGRTEVLKRIE